MDRAAIQELFDYTGYAWAGIGRLMAKRDVGLVARPASGSGWPALRDCFGHQLMAYDDWLAELEGRPMLDFNPKAADSWAEIEAYAHTVRERFAAYLAPLTDEELFSERDMDVDGERMCYTPAQLLANVLIHDRGHHGDVTTLFFQHGIPDKEWPWLDYRGYVNAKRGYGG